MDYNSFMNKVALLLTGLACFVARETMAAEPPRGSVLELHSCELFAGGCIVSSEATLDGRYMLRAWNFNGGSFGGVELDGLNVALLQASSENLAASKTAPGQAVAYLPAGATEAQRKALLAWLKSEQPGLGHLDIRVVPLKFVTQGSSYVFSAGQFISLATAPLESCENGSCGESLWYSPRSANNVFAVAVNHTSHVNEPMLKLEWKDAGKRSVFLARFGETSPGKDVYVTTADLCGAKGALF
jgi:hypothetical protein